MILHLRNYRNLRFEGTPGPRSHLYDGDAVIQSIASSNSAIQFAGIRRMLS